MKSNSKRNLRKVFLVFRFLYLKLNLKLLLSFRNRIEKNMFSYKGYKLATQVIMRDRNFERIRVGIKTYGKRNKNALFILQFDIADSRQEIGRFFFLALVLNESHLMLQLLYALTLLFWLGFFFFLFFFAFFSFQDFQVETMGPGCHVDAVDLELSGYLVSVGPRLG